MRNKLRENWPGIYIPNIPPKKTVGNLDSKLIDTRMKLLNKFCENLYKSNHIYKSEEVKIYFSPQTRDMFKELDNLKKENYEELSKKYKNVFLDYNEV